MTTTAATSATPDRSSPGTAGGDDAARAALLRAANINPRTGLATDYLNHFNEAIMLLEMVPDMPECAEDFLDWHPLSYAEHFTASNFKARDLAISAYDSADPEHPRRIRQYHRRHDLDPDRGERCDATGQAGQDPRHRWPIRLPAGSSRW